MMVILFSDSGEVMRHAFEGERPPGAPTAVYSVSTPNSELDPRSRALLEIADVVAQRRDVAQALIESEQLLTTYFSASKVGFCILDTDFRYVAINHTLAEMNGFPA